jgi:hypothetical protein
MVTVAFFGHGAAFAAGACSADTASADARAIAANLVAFFIGNVVLSINLNPGWLEACLKFTPR